MKRGSERSGRPAAACVEPLEGRSLMSAGGIFSLIAVSQMQADAANADALAAAADQQTHLPPPRGGAASRPTFPGSRLVG